MSSTSVFIENYSAYTFTRYAYSVEHGKWESGAHGDRVPPPVIEPGHQDKEGDFVPGIGEWVNVSDGAGTQGQCKYHSKKGNVEHEDLLFEWINPVVGTNTFRVPSIPAELDAQWGDISGNNMVVRVTIKKKVS
jgi:hypothetical protein